MTYKEEKMLIQEHKPHIKIFYDKILHVVNQPKETINYPYNIECSAIDLPQEWIPKILYVEKIIAIMESHEILPTDGSLVYDYSITLTPTPETGEKVSVIFRNKNMAFAYLKALRDNREINLKTEFPEVFL